MDDLHRKETLDKIIFPFMINSFLKISLPSLLRRCMLEPHGLEEMILDSQIGSWSLSLIESK